MRYFPKRKGAIRRLYFGFSTGLDVEGHAGREGEATLEDRVLVLPSLEIDALGGLEIDVGAAKLVRRGLRAARRLSQLLDPALHFELGRQRGAGEQARRQREQDDVLPAYGRLCHVTGSGTGDAGLRKKAAP